MELCFFLFKTYLNVYSGLPWVFWLAIGSLIVLFHLYLIRLICKEYHSSATLPSTINRTYYSNRGRLAS